MADPKKNLYFIAVIPPPNLEEELLTYKKVFSDNYKSKAALHSPAHITLHMPFEWKEKKEKSLIEGLSEVLTHQGKINLALDDFGAFAPRVIYVQVVPSPELQTLHDHLHRVFKIKFGVFNARYGDLPFHPHVTLAFRDLKKSEFQAAWNEFREKTFKRSFVCDRLSLLKRNGNKWKVFHEFHFA